MQVRIMKPTKNAMQSGENKNKWIVEPVRSFDKLSIDPLLGRVSSTDMGNEIRISFASLSEAIKFAESKKYSYEIIETCERKLIKKSYAENFTNRT